MSSSQYDAIARDYSAPSRHEHPIGRMNYETWLEELGGVSGLRILDLGCGSGHTSRLLAMRGAIVTGLDISSEMITIARATEQRQRLGIAYIQSDATKVLLGERYEVVTPTYLFNYATSKEELLEMAHTTASHLLPGGKMVALNLSQRPIVPRLRNGQHASAWFPGDAPWKDGSRVSFVIFDIHGEPVCEPIVTRYWSTSTYRDAFEAAGLIDINWVPIRVSKDCMERFDNWQELAEHNISTVITARMP